MFYHFLYIQSINICPQYELVNILMIEILKVVGKCKIYQKKGPGKPVAGHLTKQLPRWLGYAKLWKFAFGVGVVTLGID